MGVPTRREPTWTLRRWIYLGIAALAALVMLSWMHNPEKVRAAVGHVVGGQESGHQQSHPYVEQVEQEEKHPFIEPEPWMEPTTTTSSVAHTTSITSSTSTNHHSSQQTSSTIPMFNGEIVDGLTAEQCDEVFPDMYLEIDRRVDYWKSRNHKISAQDVEISFRERKEIDGVEIGGGAMRILIHENELRIVESVHTINHLGYRGRAIGSLELIERALASAKVGGEHLPTIEAAMLFEDDSATPDDETDTHSFWTYTMNVYRESHKRVWMMPNFDLWYAHPMGSFQDAKRRARQHNKPFSEKIQQLVWRGHPWNWELRGALIDMTEDKPWADVKIAEWGGRDSDVGLSQEALCKYAMTVHTEGVTYSGRLKFLLNCNSLLFVHDLEWITYYTHLLERSGPKQNYINVNREWTDLEEKVLYYLDHPDEAEKIIANHLELFDKYLSKAATSCYIRKLIKAYASVSFTPEVNSTTPEGKEVVNLRGRSFQRFMDHPQDYWEEYVDI